MASTGTKMQWRGRSCEENHASAPFLKLRITGQEKSVRQGRASVAIPGCDTERRDTRRQRSSWSALGKEDKEMNNLIASHFEKQKDRTSNDGVFDRGRKERKRRIEGQKPKEVSPGEKKGLKI